MEDLKKLLELARSKQKPTDSEVVSIEESDLQKYINKIKKGLDRVPSYVIYYHYINSVEDPKSKVYFFRELCKKIKRVRTGKQRSYMIDKSCLNFSEQDFDRAKNFDKEYNEQKKKNKVSRTRSISKSKK